MGEQCRIVGVDIAAEVDKIWFAISELGRKIDDPLNPQTSPSAPALDQHSVSHWLETLEVHPLAKKAFNARIRSEYTVEPDQLSLLDLARWGRYYYDDPFKDRNAYRIKGGNDSLPNAMARVLPDIRLNCVVTAVHQTEEGVEVVYQSPDGTEVILSSSYVIFAIPFGPLQAIIVEPRSPLFFNSHLRN